MFNVQCVPNLVTGSIADRYCSSAP